MLAGPITTRRRVPAVLLSIVLLFVAACTGDSGAGPDPTIPTTTTVPPIPRENDGVLRIGALIPTSDTIIGLPLQATLEAAVDRINEAGGVLGNDVELIVQDEGATGATASAGIGLLLAEDVDAIIGPSSSVNAIAALEDAVSADIVTCSATAAALRLDDFPDDRLFFRTIAGDSLQAIALADAAEDTGARDVAIVHVDDAYGRPYASALADALEDRQLEVVETIVLAVGDDELGDEVDSLLDSSATVAIVIGAAGDSARFLAALGRAEFDSLSDVIVNDAARGPEAQPVIAELPVDLRLRLTGVAPQITVRGDDTDITGPFGPQAVDCVNLIALSAVQVGSDSPALIASQMPPVSAGGSICTTFALCAADLAAGLQINYNGPTGVTELNREGESSRAVFDRFGFDEDGIDVFQRSVITSR